MATLVNDGLSPALFSAIQRQRKSYTRTGYLSTTSSIDSPRVRVLELRHDNEIVINASTLLPSFFGTCIHNELERHHETFEIDGIAMEKEFTIDIGGIKYSGRPDWYSMPKEEIGDFKTTGVWVVQVYPDGKPDHFKQLAIGAYLIRQYGFPCTNGWIELIHMDWKKSAATHNRRYPNRTEMIIFDTLWSDEDTKQYIEDRVALHLKADDANDNELPPCSAEEQWKKPDVYAVIPRGAKNALRGSLSCRTEAEANALAEQNDLRGYKIDFRQGERTRCEHYCNARPWCNQYVEEKANV